MSNRSGKRATNELPSTVPNDYDHLGVPGSVNMRLSGRSRKRKPQVRRRSRMPNWTKALLAMMAGTFAFGLVLLVIAIIAFPPFFRGLEPRYQQRLIDMFPPFDALRPTVPFDTIPTLGGANDSDAAQQLLMTQDETATPSPTPQASQAADQPDTQTTPPPTAREIRRSSACAEGCSAPEILATRRVTAG